MTKISGLDISKSPAPDRVLLLKMYERMRLIRIFEDNVHDLFAAGSIPGFVHLYAGEEAVGVGAMFALNQDDYITSTHRGHGHCIAKGADLNKLLAEIYGKTTGFCKGKGGSMHICDMTHGILGTNGIVGAGVPLAAGAALSAKTRGTKQVAVSFFSDGAMNQGGLHEGINLAAVLDLPCIFICENNGYADTTAVSFSSRAENIVERIASYGIPTIIVDGQNVVEMYQAMHAAVAHARAGKGPAMIEAKTYRYYGHFEGDNLKYRTAEEVDYWRARDPLKVFAESIAPAAGITATEMEAADKRAQEQVAKAIEFAENSPAPDPGEHLMTDVFETV